MHSLDLELQFCEQRLSWASVMEAIATISTKSNSTEMHFNTPILPLPKLLILLEAKLPKVIGEEENDDIRPQYRVYTRD